MRPAFGMMDPSLLEALWCSGVHMYPRPARSRQNVLRSAHSLVGTKEKARLSGWQTPRPCGTFDHVRLRRLPTAAVEIK